MGRNIYICVIASLFLRYLLYPKHPKIYYHAQLSPLIRIAKYPCVVDETNYLNEISYDQISKLFYNSNIIHPTHRVALIPKHIPGNVIF